MHKVTSKQVAVPNLIKAVKSLFNDQGLSIPKHYHLPSIQGLDGNVVDWRRVEKFLAQLSEDELETFCVGEQDEMVAISEQYEDGEYAYAAIDELFMHIGC